jgi:hypothetical protein
VIDQLADALFELADEHLSGDDLRRRSLEHGPTLLLQPRAERADQRALAHACFADHQERQRWEVLDRLHPGLDAGGQGGVFDDPRLLTAGAPYPAYRVQEASIDAPALPLVQLVPQRLSERHRQAADPGLELARVDVRMRLQLRLQVRLLALRQARFDERIEDARHQRIAWPPLRTADQHRTDDRAIGVPLQHAQDIEGDPGACAPQVGEQGRHGSPAVLALRERLRRHGRQRLIGADRIVDELVERQPPLQKLVHPNPEIRRVEQVLGMCGGFVERQQRLSQLMWSAHAAVRVCQRLGRRSAVRSKPIPLAFAHLAQRTRGEEQHAPDDQHDDEPAHGERCFDACAVDSALAGDRQPPCR